MDKIYRPLHLQMQENLRSKDYSKAREDHACKKDKGSYLREGHDNYQLVNHFWRESEKMQLLSEALEGKRESMYLTDFLLN